ncbi:MAG: hypothetical protein NWF01_07355 [Candidatus Bathyarchaeota archaeon]|nr:hypothetical protein [Candidatus Bathyarchaeota archaeon]
MKRNEAIALIKELLEGCAGLDGQNLQLVAPVSALGGYQVMLSGNFEEQTIECIKALASKHGFACQLGNIWKTKRGDNLPNTLIVYKPKK